MFNWSCWVIWQAMILTRSKRELCLNEQFVARHHPLLDAITDSRTNGGFEVVFALIGGIDSTKSLLNCKLG